MKLHNRQVKAEFWTDTELQYELDCYGRLFYMGLIQIADDSGCLYDDPRAFKLLLFPVDEAFTAASLSTIRDCLIQMGKLVPYESAGKRCLFLKNFHKHQSLFNPTKPEVPLPEWVSFVPSESSQRNGKYVVASMQPENSSAQPDIAACAQPDSRLHSTSYSYSGSGKGGPGEKPSATTATTDEDEAWRQVAMLFRKHYPSEKQGRLEATLKQIREEYDGNFKPSDIEAQIFAHVAAKTPDLKPWTIMTPFAKPKRKPILRTVEEQDHCMRYDHYPEWDAEKKVCTLCGNP